MGMFFPAEPLYASLSLPNLLGFQVLTLTFRFPRAGRGLGRKSRSSRKPDAESFAGAYQPSSIFEGVLFKQIGSKIFIKVPFCK